MKPRVFYLRFPSFRQVTITRMLDCFLLCFRYRAAGMRVVLGF